MCGIVGYIGTQEAEEIILSGLEKLEYRGYDSAGISIVDGNKIFIEKKEGKLINLVNKLKENPLKGNIGIGHTRWATHGIPSDINSHPHTNNNESIAVVHNGIIENFLELKLFLKDKGYYFKSETDTEVIANLIDYYFKGDLESAVKLAVGRLKGSYALGVISKDAPNELIAIRHESPLILGILEDGFMIASDIPALLKYTRNVIYLDDDEIVKLTTDNHEIKSLDNKNIIKEIQMVEWNLESASKEGYEHYMLKEIFEQPDVIAKAISIKLNEGKINLEDNTFNREELENFNKIYMIGCGTAFHAGEVGKLAIEKFLNRPVQSEIASEFKYYQPFVDDKTLIIVVSQSGETGDTLAAMREARKKGAKILAITNVVGSSIARESDKVIYCYAGPEISVASTKAYTTQLIALYFLALDMAEKLGTLSSNEISNYISEMELLPEKIRTILNNTDEYKVISDAIKDSISIFYLGRGVDYLTAKEGALKLKEISYINTVAFQAGELKHGSIALIEDGTPVITVVSQENLVEKSISNIKEVKARGAKTIAIGYQGNSLLTETADYTVFVPKTLDLLSPVLTVIPEQLIAYYTAVAVGNDVDKPRNLAKAVTVE